MGTYSTVLALMLYVATAVLFFGSASNWEEYFVGVGGDPMTYIWSLNWWPWSIGRGINPMVSHYVWSPGGFHMAWADAVPGAALIGLPLILMKNAAVAYNVLMVLAPAMAAWCGFLLVRYLTRGLAASLLAGYFFGFSSYELTHMRGHLSLVLVFLIPIILLICIRRLRDEIPRLRFVAALTACMVLLFGFSPEIFATSYILGAMAGIAAFLMVPNDQRNRLRYLAREVAIATTIVVLILSPWLLSMLQGRDDVPDQINPPSQFSTDLLNFIVPTTLTQLGGSALAHVSARFSGGIAEDGGYLGLPLIVILLLWCRETWGTAPGRILPLMIVLCVALSVGPTVAIGGVHTNVWGPWQLFLNLPLIGQALPARFAMYVALLTAIAAGFWLAAAQTAWGGVARLALGVASIAFLLPNRESFGWSPLPFLPFFEREAVERVLGPQPNILVLPFFDERNGRRGPAMISQWQSQMSFTQSSGYVGNIPPRESTWVAISSLSQGRPGSNFSSDIRMYVGAHQVSAIVAAPGTPQLLINALAQLSWSEEAIGGVRIFHVPDSEEFPYFQVAGQYWPTPDAWGWMGQRVTVTAKGADYIATIEGKWRPTALAPAVVQILRGSKATTELVGTDTVITVPLSSGDQITITTKSVFVPDRFFANGDLRELSVLLNVRQRK